VVLVEPDFERELFKAMDDNVLLCLLLGVVGTGKTLSACRWLHEKGADSARYCRSKDVAALSPKYDGDRPALEALQSAPQLVIDEVGMEEERDWGKIEDLLHLRYEWRRPTVALANLKPKAFEQRYKERIARRVSALGKTIVARDVLCPGEKRRLMGRQEKLNV
jgi:DNA replication protein DnaC